MVDKIIINPERIRGVGNIISPKSYSDYTQVKCELTEGSETINNIEMPILSMKYLLEKITTNLTITSDNWVIYDTNTLINISATLKDESNNVLTGKTLKLYKNDTFVESIQTNNNGIATFTSITISSKTNIQIKTLFEGDNEYNTVQTFKTIYVGGTVSINNIVVL